MILPAIYKVPLDLAGELYVMPRPSEARLREDIGAIREMGISQIISLLELREAEQLGLAKENVICREFRIEFVQHPVEDLSLPETDGFSALVKSTCAALRGGTGVAVHCRAGIGRTGMLASCILIRCGVEAEQAISTVSAARQVQVPDTDEQRRFILNF